MLALPHTPVVLAGPDLQSALVQHPDVGTHAVEPEQFLNPLLHVIAQVPPDVHVAAPFDVGAVHDMHPAPQKVVLVSDWQMPLQLCVPVGQVPLHASALPMQAPLHSFDPVGHAGTHASPSHVTVPPPVGA